MSDAEEFDPVVHSAKLQGKLQVRVDHVDHEGTILHFELIEPSGRVLICWPEFNLHKGDALLLDGASVELKLALSSERNEPIMPVYAPSVLQETE